MNTLRRNPNIRRFGLPLALTAAQRRPAPNPSAATASSADVPTTPEPMPSCTIDAKPLGNRAEEFHIDVQNSDYPVDEYNFLFGDGDQSKGTSDTVRHTYPHAGAYAVNAFLHVQDELGLPPIKGISCEPTTISVE